MVVDAQVDEDVGEARVAAAALDDEERRGLLAAAVTAGGLRRGETFDEPACERLPGRPLEGDRGRGDRLRAGEDVSLSRIAGAGAVAGPVDALPAGIRRRVAVAVDDAELALVATVVGTDQPPHDVVRGGALSQQREALRSVPRVRIRLRRDRADLGLRPRHDRADGEELRLPGDAPLARC